ncbi:glycosyl hydrolase [Kordiimonas aquimaris]|uniref:glycosyl hydrolase n=1 Tax=Kordiimonas aquimaris TaxID=707591 RepID=UPI0021CFCF05|nr:glycosyl hydrolase [Kordiimonas aquimaris]
MTTKPKFPKLKSLAICAALLSGSALMPAHSADANPFASLKLRNIGPALTSGRISDFAFHPDKKHEFYVATASGNLWKTNNNGITWQALFEKEASYALGVVTLDPNNSDTVWVGTGENNAQRSVADGDGVYKSIDGGKTWKNMGLKASGHISQIWIDPNDSDIVLVAAQGPLWNSGGDRGLYKTTDGGASWNHILEIDEHTGVNEFVVDPNDHDNIVVSTYQRRRHVWVLINGGPGSGIRRTTDGGVTWTEVSSGLPSKDDMGRIGLAQAPSAPNTLYAIIEASDAERGTYRSDNFGVTWRKQSGHITTSPQYYNEIVVDPNNPDRIYSMDTFSSVSEDAGKTWTRLSARFRHVDDHAFWIDPDNSDHVYIGGDGGVYESWDRGQNWRHMRNLPITQFYRIQPDNALPFYNVCGGTQDNNSLCAPSRTTDIHGIANEDWTIILGGDGYEPQPDPTDHNIIYTQYQYGGLARYDRRTQERVYMTPQPESGENIPKWNWNTPLVISPHDNKRIYYAAERVYRSDDRGDNWASISPDLTQKVDRNQLEVMGRVWSVDAIAKNDSTSLYGSIIGLSESAIVPNLLYVGTDDGQISVSEDGGGNWRSVNSFRGVPDMSLVEDVQASMHDENVAYAAVDNHKRGDFKPYLLKTTNKGRTWRLISGNLPERGSVHTIIEDHVDPNLLFVGTEFGLFFTQDGGENWHPMKAGFPTIAVRDLEIQRRESDLVVGTFGRGIYILDDYSPLRFSADQVAGNAATTFPMKDTWLYIQGDQYGNELKGSQGDSYYTAENPDFGAIFTYYLSDGFKTKASVRRTAERAIEKEGGNTPYPSWDALRAEDTEEAPTVLLTITDTSGDVVRRIEAPKGKGMHRIAWDLRLDAAERVSLRTQSGYVPPWVRPPFGPLALPGEYTATLAVRQSGELSLLGEPQNFTVKALNNSPEITTDRAALLDFQKKTAALRRAVDGTNGLMGEMRQRIDHLGGALVRSEKSTEAQKAALTSIEADLQVVSTMMNGDRTIGSRNEPVPMSINRRVGSIIQGHWRSQAPATGLHQHAYEIAAREFTEALSRLRNIDECLQAFEDDMNAIGAPWTPGRVPVWQP